MAVNWHGAHVRAKLKSIMARRIQMAARYLRDRIKEQVSEPNAMMITTKSGKRRVKRGTRGTNPSLPGAYPKKVIGHFRRNIVVEFNRSTMKSRIGTNVLYGKYLQTGTKKMAARPWLTLGLAQFGPQMQQILNAGGEGE